MGYDAVAICWNRNKKDPAKKSFYDVRFPAGYNSPSLLLQLPYIWKEQLRLLATYNPSIVLAGHYFLLPLAIYWRYIYGWRKRKIFYDAIEHYPEHLSSYLKHFKKLSLFLFALIENLMVSCCNGLFCVDSRDDRIEKRLKKWNRHLITIWNVPSFLDDPTGYEVEKANKLFQGKSCIAFVGGASIEKGIRTAFLAASIVARVKKNIAFLFIGPFMNNEVIIKKMVRELNICNYFHFLGSLPYRQMMAYLKQSRIAIALHQNHPYYKQLSAGNGRKFFSYMQAGLPIIGPNIGEIGRAVEMADCGTLIDTSDEVTVANTIIHLLDNSFEASRLGNNGRWAFENHFNWESEALLFKKFVKIYF